MSFAATFNAFQVSGISKSEQHVLTAICTFADKNGVCWPSVETIAKRCLSSVRTVQVHISALVAKGLLQRIYRKGRSAITKVLIPTPAESAPLPPQNLHPEPAIESVNTIIAAPPAEPLPAAVSPPLLFSEIPEQPKTAIEPSQNMGEACPLPEALQSTVDRSMASISEPPAEKQTSELDNPVIDLQVDTQTQVAVDPLVDVPATLLQDLGEVRKAKKRTPKPTRTEANLWFAEAQKAGWTMEQVILTMVLHGWSRFEASWVQHVPQQVVVQGPQAVWKPEPAPEASPEVVASCRAKLAELRARILADSARRREDQVAVRH